MDQYDIMKAIEVGDTDTLRDLMSDYADLGFASEALAFAESPTLEMRLVGLNVFAQQLAQGVNIAFGRSLAEAIHSVALAHLDDPDVHVGLNSRRTEAAASAVALADAYLLMGAYEDVVALFEASPKYLRGYDHHPLQVGLMRNHEINLRHRSVKALIQLGRFEDADRGLAQLQSEFQGVEDHSTFTSLRNQLREHLQSATEVAAQKSLDEIAISAYTRALMDIINSMYWLQKEAGADSGVLHPIIEAFQGELKSAPTSLQQVLKKQEEMREALSWATAHERSEFHEWTNRVSETTSILLDPQPSAGQLTDLLTTLEPAQAWFEANGHRHEAQHALWYISLCHARLSHTEEAIISLRKLAECIETDRARITDPLRRAGTAARFPKLYPRLVSLSAAVDDSRGALAAIEASKGRSLADLLTYRERSPVDDAGVRLDPLVAERLTRSLGVHYLSFLVDDDATYAILVTKTGRWISEKVPLGRARFKDLAKDPNPKLWGTKANLLRTGVDVPTEFSPLVAWLRPLFESGDIADDDHLVYSPDEYLYHVPLHALDFCGEPLVTRLKLSRIHCLSTLDSLTHGMSVRPKTALALYVPASDEREPNAKHAAFASTVSSIGAFLPVSAPDGRRVNPEYVCGLNASQTLLHFSVHGDFPHAELSADNSPTNPYDEAGLWLADAGELPARQEATWPSRLTPRRVMESSDLNLTGTHVTLEACVSGLAREGIGGDALGLEWALLAKGAASVLSTHWNVDFGSAAAFSRLFYQAWLSGERNRADAWRHAVLSLRAKPANMRNPASWAAFSLTGDWR